MRIYTIDFHTHLLEKGMKANDYWKGVARAGLDGVAITEHADCGAKEAYEKLLETKPSGIVLIPGVEVNSNAGHILVYGKNASLYNVKELFEDKVDFEKLIRAVKREGLMLCVAHPWGFGYDSAAYLYGARKLEDIIKGEGLGVEVYNGMIGHLNNFIYESGWIKRPINFCDFLEKNRIARKTGLDKLGGRVKGELNKKTREVIIRCASALELGELGSFITAGSDAHSAERIGAGILKFKSEDEDLDVSGVLDALYDKDNIIWSGPLVKEVKEGVYERVEDPISKKEMVQGVRYAIARAAGRKTIAGKLKKGKDALGKKAGGSKIKERIVAGKNKIVSKVRKKKAVEGEA